MWWCTSSSTPLTCTSPSGLESGPPSSACSSPPTPPLPSEPESDTSDLAPRSPASDAATRPRRRAAAAPGRRGRPAPGKLRVSLHRLPPAAEHPPPEVAAPKAEGPGKLADMKVEMAKLDSILQGNLLLDKSSHKISDILLLDSLKARVEELPKVATYSSSDSSTSQHKLGEVGEGREEVVCKWENCGERLQPPELLEHLKEVHVARGSAVACRWAGCKVFGAVSSSRTWLSHHVTGHVGSKPFLCIVAGCRHRFGTQTSLSRHVNSHFKPPCTPGPGAPRRGGGDTSPCKTAVRKNRRKLSLRGGSGASNGPNRSGDLFHIGVMAGVREGLARLKPAERRQVAGEQVTFDRSGQAVLLTSRVVSRRLEESGEVNYLISWSPQGMYVSPSPHMLPWPSPHPSPQPSPYPSPQSSPLTPSPSRPDEWVPGGEHRGRCKVPIRQLGPEVRARVEEQLFGRRGRRGRKQGCSRGPPPLT